MTDLFAEAMITFRDLLDAARASGDPEPTAMTLATRGEQDRLAARTVLLKAHDDRGFVFYTNTRSRKGEDLAAHPSAALLFHWKHLRHGVQVRIEGAVQPVTDDEADRYFASRPRMSQIGAWASDQSRTLDRRETFEARIAEIEQRFEGQDVPRPPHWSGYRVVPQSIEFWYAADFRLHERQLYERQEDGSWTRRMLFP
ncbi:MAG: pyridoxamine 5'-phosphate oxidase [Xanthomonadales bacterium]|nr:pyridoxamine 5'-phosphate oxidase [Xanthomonadales bacterium]